MKKMRDPAKHRGPSVHDRRSAEQDHQAAHEDALDEEEKLLAGRHDVNMPALLTRDVKGG